MNAQLPLLMRWPAQQRFETFVAGANGAILAQLRELACAPDANWVVLCGPAGSGKTHLLLAACAQATAGARSAQYASIAGAGGQCAAALRGLGGSDLLALDDLQALAGNATAEHALFDLYNRCRAEGGTMLFGSDVPLANLSIGLPDLRSRLSACVQLLLRPLDDAARRALVRERAGARGLELDDAALDWLFAHTPRDPGSLIAHIERIDHAALAAQRRVTVPFLRDLLARAQPDASADASG